ncbi:hypothetical protein CPB83DRAFT_841329 [Crepidotus variabilis]|uniref:Tektin n=1 Tax=Crepidotus variabilis TaxID=179855 RepID=A0A9P6BBL1_9AGAR|nr:hypothetical protein CPB83DRAFT_841329 [Crepidotus variabilis]
MVPQTSSTTYRTQLGSQRKSTSVRISSVFRDVALPQKGCKGGYDYSLRELRQRRLRRIKLLQERTAERAAAEIVSVEQELHELDLITDINHRNLSISDLRLPTAQLLANAVTETLTSLRDSLELVVEEIQLHLEDARDHVSEVEISIMQAILQQDQLASH